MAIFNYLLNPGFEVDLTGWSKNLGTETTARDGTHFQFGSQALKLQTPGGATAEGTLVNATTGVPLGTAAQGDTWTASIYVFSVSGGETMTLQNIERNAAGSGVGTSTTNVTLAAGWQRVTCTRTYTSATVDHANMKFVTNGTQIVTLWLDGALLEKTASASVWADGNFAGYGWAGAANESVTVTVPTSDPATAPVALGGTTPSPHRWRVLICDMFGDVISDITKVAFGKQYVAQLNRPAQFTFWVPSDDPRVAGLNTQGSYLAQANGVGGDDLPFLYENRTLRCYRQELQSDGSLKWVNRFSGHVWILQDSGDEATQKTLVTAYDPLFVLSMRFARRMIWNSTDGNLTTANAKFITGYNAATSSNGDDSSFFSFYPYDEGATLNSTTGLPNSGFGANDGDVMKLLPGTEIARGLLNATNTYDGFTGMSDYYVNNHTQASNGFNQHLIYPNGTNPQLADTRPPNSTAVSPYVDNQKVGDLLLQLTAANESFDLSIDPIDTEVTMVPGSGVTNMPFPFGTATEYGTTRVTTYACRSLAQLRFYAPTKGNALTNVVFAWGTAPHTASQVTRTVDMTNLTNYTNMIGKGTRAKRFSPGSISAYGRTGMDDPSATTLTDQIMLSQLATEEVKLGGISKTLVTIVPTVGISALPFTDFNVGDWVQVIAGSNLRGGFLGAVRVYGFTLDIPDDSTTEIVSSIQAVAA